MVAMAAAPAASRPNGYLAPVATPGPQATTSVNAARANGGTRGQQLPDRGQAAMLTGRPIGGNPVDKLRPATHGSAAPPTARAGHAGRGPSH